MMILFYVVFIITNGYFANEYNFTTKTVPVGEDVKLTCARQTDVLYRENLFWIRIVSGKKPELLGGTMNFDFDVEIRKSHITAKQEPGSFVLEINGAMESDDGVYYCIKVQNLDLKFLTGTFLNVKGREPHIVAVTERFLSDQVYPGDPITLECSVLSSSDHETCAAEQRVFWFKTQSNKSHPHVIYAHGNSSDECLRTPEAPSVQRCVYSFNKNFISSDAGTYYCAVAACGEIFYGNGTTLTGICFSSFSITGQHPKIFFIFNILLNFLQSLTVGFFQNFRCGIYKQTTLFSLSCLPLSLPASLL
uniref:Ig-like domain-containing protein n=1 Tax=Oryzias latipes TaxID=8090 RepID=A0A3P9LWJ5_ORYLA